MPWIEGPPAAGLFTAGVQASMAPWAPPGSDWDAHNIAICAMFEPVSSLVMDVGSPDEPESFTPGWGVLLDVDQCPSQFLPYLAMYVGLYVAPGTDDATARAAIRAEAAWNRGSGWDGTYNSSTIGLAPPANGGAIVTAAQRWLSGTQNVTLIERTAANGSQDAYHFILQVRPEQLIDVNGLTNAVNAVKPVGVQWTLVQTDGEIWSNASRTFNSDTTTWNQKG